MSSCLCQINLRFFISFKRSLTRKSPIHAPYCSWNVGATYMNAYAMVNYCYTRETFPVTLSTSLLIMSMKALFHLRCASILYENHKTSIYSPVFSFFMYAMRRHPSMTWKFHAKIFPITHFWLTSVGFESSAYWRVMDSQLQHLLVQPIINISILCVACITHGAELYPSF